MPLGGDPCFALAEPVEAARPQVGTRQIWSATSCEDAFVPAGVSSKLPLQWVKAAHNIIVITSASAREGQGHTAGSQRCWRTEMKSSSPRDRGLCTLYTVQVSGCWQQQGLQGQLLWGAARAALRWTRLVPMAQPQGTAEPLSYGRVPPRKPAEQRAKCRQGWGKPCEKQSCQPQGESRRRGGAAPGGPGKRRTCGRDPVEQDRAAGWASGRQPSTRTWEIPLDWLKPMLKSHYNTIPNVAVHHCVSPSMYRAKADTQFQCRIIKQEHESTLKP